MVEDGERANSVAPSGIGFYQFRLGSVFVAFRLGSVFVALVAMVAMVAMVRVAVSLPTSPVQTLFLKVLFADDESTYHEFVSPCPLSRPFFKSFIC